MQTSIIQAKHKESNSQIGQLRQKTALCTNNFIDKPCKQMSTKLNCCGFLGWSDLATLVFGIVAVLWKLVGEWPEAAGTCNNSLDTDLRSVKDMVFWCYSPAVLFDLRLCGHSPVQRNFRGYLHLEGVKYWSLDTFAPFPLWIPAFSAGISKLPDLFFFHVEISCTTLDNWSRDCALPSGKWQIWSIH